jgi:hypothetical protein
MKPHKRYTLVSKTQTVELLASGKAVPVLPEEHCVSSHLLYNFRAGTRIP